MFLSGTIGLAIWEFLAPLFPGVATDCGFLDIGCYLAVFARDVFMKPIAIILWMIDLLLLYVGLLIQWFTQILTLNVFAPGFTLVAGQLRTNLLPIVFTFAVFLLGITYVLAAFWMKQANLVDWKKAVAWLLFALLFYSSGVDLFLGSESFRRSLGAIMYTSLLGIDVTSCQANIPTADELLGPFAGGTTGDFSDMGCLENFFGGPDGIITDTSVDGLDVAMAFMKAQKDDVIPPSSLPGDFEDDYFGSCDSASECIDGAVQGLQRLFFGLFIVVFGIGEQFVFMMIAIAMGIIFLLMLYAVLLAFFNHTEYIAKAILRMWFQMLMTSLFASIVTSSALFLLLLTATAVNPLVWVGGSIVSLIIVYAGVRSISKSVMEMINSIPQTVAGMFNVGMGMAGMANPYSMGGGGMYGGMGGGMMGGGMGGGMMGGGMGGGMGSGMGGGAGQALLGATPQGRALSVGTSAMSGSQDLMKGGPGGGVGGGPSGSPSGGGSQPTPLPPRPVFVPDSMRTSVGSTSSQKPSLPPGTGSDSLQKPTSPEQGSSNVSPSGRPRSSRERSISPPIPTTGMTSGSGSQGVSSTTGMQQVTQQQSNEARLASVSRPPSVKIPQQSDSESPKKGPTPLTGSKN